MSFFKSLRMDVVPVDNILSILADEIIPRDFKGEIPCLSILANGEIYFKEF